MKSRPQASRQHQHASMECSVQNPDSNCSSPLWESDQLTSVPATAGCSRWNRSVHSHPDGCKETTYCMVLGPRRDGLVVSFFSFRCRGVYLARLQAFLAPGYNTCSCFGGSCQGKAQRDCLVIPSCVLKCRPAIVSLLCILTHVLRYPGAQIPDSILL